VKFTAKNSTTVTQLVKTLTCD